MAKEIVWKNLTCEEAETLAQLVKNGKPVFATPIIIEHSGQLESLGITWKQVRTWHIGSEEVKVHLTPTDKDTHDYIMADLRRKHHDGFYNVISWEEYTASGREPESSDMEEAVINKITYADIKKLMDTENPLIAQCHEMHILGKMSAEQIAAKLNIKQGNVYYYLDRAKAIGEKYKAN